MQAARSIEGAIDRPVFALFWREVLVPSLRPGHRVIRDNLSVRRDAEVRRLIEAVGCTLHPFHPLLAYSPDLNPIELAFSKLKTLPRQTGARTRDGLDVAISAASPHLSAAAAHAWTAACGYGQS